MFDERRGWSFEERVQGQRTVLSNGRNLSLSIGYRKTEKEGERRIKDSEELRISPMMGV